MQYFNTLISSHQLASLITSADANSPLVIVDCRFSLAEPDSGYKEYKTSHIPGSIYAHLDNDLAGNITPESGRHPLPDINSFVQLINLWGITSGTQVVVYDDAAGTIAGRLWWMMKWVGHNKVAVLDGGYSAWKVSGQVLSSQIKHENRITGGDGFISTINHDMFIDSDEVADRLEKNSIALFDSRSEPRFIGEHEPIDRVAGHIPGAVNLPFDQNLDNTGLFLPPGILKQRLQNVYGDSDSVIVHMCGSGVTACHNILGMEIAGIKTGNRPVKLYVGSWSEWITDPLRAVESL